MIESILLYALIFVFLGYFPSVYLSVAILELYVARNDVKRSVLEILFKQEPLELLFVYNPKDAVFRGGRGSMNPVARLHQIKSLEAITDILFSTFFLMLHIATLIREFILTSSEDERLQIAFWLILTLIIIYRVPHLYKRLKKIENSLSK